MAYPVSIAVQPATSGRNRLTVALRLLLGIPHIILVGGIGFSATRSTGDALGTSSEGGLLGAVAVFLAIISWFTLVFAGRHLPGIRQFTAFYLRWRLRVLAYLFLLTDLYPPFGDADYPATLTITDPERRDRLTIALRLLMLVPHIFVLIFLILAWWITAVIAWFMILLSGEYPKGLVEFNIGTLRWYMRVEAYALLMVDDYPPFSLSE